MTTRILRRACTVERKEDVEITVGKTPVEFARSTTRLTFTQRARTPL